MGRSILVDKRYEIFAPGEDMLRKVFKKFDADNDNQLSREEQQKAFEYLGSIIPGLRVSGLHHANAKNDEFVNEREMDELIKYAVRVGFSVKNAELFRSSSVTPRRDRHDKYYGDSFTKADANNANGDRSSSVMPRRDGHDKYYGDGFTKADAIDERFINEEEINERAKYATRYGFTTSFEFLTKEQLLEKFKLCDVNNIRQLSRSELKKRFQYFNKEELNKLVEHAPKLGFTVEP